MAPHPTPREPWERQPEESSAAWDAFVTYRDLGLQRSVTKVAQELHKSRTLLGRWSAQHGWVHRAAAWDADQDRLHRLSLADARRKAEERSLKVANALFTAASGSLLRIAKNPDSLTPHQVARFVEAASRLEQGVLDRQTLPNSHPAVTGPDDTDGLASALTDEERRDRMVALRRELNERIGDQPAYAGPAP